MFHSIPPQRLSLFPPPTNNRLEFGEHLPYLNIRLRRLITIQEGSDPEGDNVKVVTLNYVWAAFEDACRERRMQYQ